MKEIPEEIILKFMKNLQISRKEAIELYLTDNEELENEEQNELNEKAKKSRITATIHQATKGEKKKTQRERTAKKDEVKEMIIQEVSSILPKFATEIVILNKSKLISFQVGDDKFEIDLKRKAKPKKK